jgi:tRNA uridine 5-carboxymethylaminomethyl modification enzyme
VRLCKWFSTSLPEDIQFKALSSVAGFEKVKFFRPGYAIEYDYFPPTQLKRKQSLLKVVFRWTNKRNHLWKASQGLMAGINAHLKVHEKAPILKETKHTSEF